MLKRLILILLLCGVLIAPVAAEDDSHTEAAAPGLGTLVLVVGMAFIIGVGGFTWAREVFEGVDDEDD
jgi:hypothetical protein